MATRNIVQMTTSNNKKTIEKYIDGFEKSDHTQILSCLTEDVIWEMPGIFKLKGKEEFDKEIENPAFKGSPRLTINRMTEEGNIVVLEGTVIGTTLNDESFKALFCDVFEMEDHKIKRLIGFIANIPNDK